LERYGPLLIVLVAGTELWLLVAYELLILRHGVYGDLLTTWSHALGLWNG
jgi:hypothetical protein